MFPSPLARLGASEDAYCEMIDFASLIPGRPCCVVELEV